MNRSRALLVLAVLLAAAVAQLSGANPAGAAGESFAAYHALDYYDGTAVAFGDYTDDGRLDLLTTPGYTLPGPPPSATSLYQNSSGTFSAPDPAQNLPRVVQSTAAWSDYNNDGKLEILLAGQTDDGQKVARLYKQDTSGAYQRDTTADANLTGVYTGSVAWGDYNNDGKPDILLSGLNASVQPILKIYKNNGPGTAFTEDTDAEAGLNINPTTFPGVSHSSVAWGDYTGDGYLDILVTGMTGLSAYPRVAKLFKNSGGGTFTEDTTAELNLTPVEESAAAFGDYNSDGRLDILLSGCTANPSGCSAVAAKVFTNNGADTAFTEDASASLTGYQLGGAAWGDYDSDGKLDILLNGGNASGTPIAGKAYKGDGIGGFTADPTAFLALDGGSVAFGDYSGDGKLDAVFTGGHTELYNNITANADTAPNPPTKLTVSPGSNSATFSWTASTDAQQTGTPNGLTYNLRVGTTPGGSDVVSPLSLSSGKRLVPQAGNVGEATSYTLNNLTPGTRYYWCVQAVDASFMGSAFSAEQVFTPGYDADNTTFPGIEGGSVAFGDYNSDGRLDAVVTGTDTSGTAAIAKVYHQVWEEHCMPLHPDLCFHFWAWQEDTSASLTGVHASSAAWGDYNNDGHLDLLIAGANGSGQKVTTLYQGDGAGAFMAVTSASFVGVFKGSVAFVDYNSDGRPDVVVTGWDGGSHTFAKLYRNNGGGSFSEDTAAEANLVGVNFSSIAAGDYNRDGRPDLLISGSTAPNSSSPVTTELYRNNGDGTFTDLTTSAGLSAAAVEEGTVAWGDYNSDGWPDILASGNNGSGSTKVFTNNGNGTFTLDASAVLPWQQQSAAAWGDYNADGKPDLLLSGLTPSGPISVIYENQGNGAFSNIGAGLTGVTFSSVAWGDYDGNGTLDALVAGCTVGTGGGCTDSTDTTTLYTSSVGANIAPSAPSGLSASFSSGVENLSWSAPSDDHTASAALSYNLRVGISSGGTQIVSPLSLSAGTRLVPQDGNVGERTSYALTGLTPGTTYHWSVQAVDSGFAGSAFATEGTFTVPESFALSAASYSVGESAGTATITITRSGWTAGAASVHFATSNGTATAGSDYTAVSQTVTFATDETTKTVTVPISEDAAYEGIETVSLTLSDPSTGATLGDPHAATLTIVDNDVATLAFSAASYSVGEADGTATVTINRTGATASAFTVHFATANGTATAGSDYTAVSQTVSFAAGETQKTVPVPITDDSMVESSETVQLSLSSPSTGATLGSPNSATLTIVDNDVAPPPPTTKPATTTSKGKIVSCKFSKTSFPGAQAGKVKLTCKLSPKSKVFRYVLSLKQGKKWAVVKSVKKTGSFKKVTLTVKKLFAGKAVKGGQYRLKLSADKNSKTLRFTVK
jgi:Calx-beta domain/FG-GAP-like repeat/Fibronectin type III domain